MYRLIIRFVVGLLLLLPYSGAAQLTVIIERVPDYTPAQDSIYLVGSFNDWQPGDRNFRFRKLDNERYQYDFLTPMPDFEFKITRGSWPTVEGGDVSEPIANRAYRQVPRQRDTLRLSVRSWEDLEGAIPYRDTLTLRVVQVPDNTPEDATLYAVGSFNGWSPADPDFRFVRDTNGTYRTTIPIRETITEFKISRGNWSMIESRENGLARPNRRFNYDQDDPEDLLTLEVVNWEDLAGQGFNWYTLILLLAAVQGILLVIAINSFKERRRYTNRILSLLIITLSITFLARIGAFDRDIFQRFPKIILLPDLIYFLYGPLFWLYLRSLTPNRPYRWRWYWHFLPLALAILVYLPQILKPAYGFITQVVDLQLRPLFIGMGAAGLIFSTFYWVRSRSFLQRLHRAYAAEGLPLLDFLQTVFYLHTACLISWLSTYLVGAIGIWLGAAWTPITDRMTDATWLVLAIGAYTMGYYAMRHPKIFRSSKLYLPLEEAPSEAMATIQPLVPIHGVAHPPKDQLLSPDEIEFQTLQNLMREQRPFLNPGLSLGELADLAGQPSHRLSKIINDRFGNNFFDYVNSYRIKSFQERVARGDHMERTILSLALEAGFNSKTAFNRAFKKQTGMTPRQYLRAQDIK